MEHVHEHGDHSHEHSHSHTADQLKAEAAKGRGFGRLLLELRPYWAQMLLALGCSLGHHGLGIGAAALGAWLVGSAATGTPAGDLVPAFVLLLGLVVIRAILAWLENWHAHDAAFKLLADMRLRLYWTLERLAPGYLIRRRSGDIASSALEDVDLLEYFFAHTAMPFIVALVIPFAALVGLAFVQWLLPLVLLPWVVLVALVPFWLGKKAVEQGQVLRERSGEFNAEMVDSLQGLREIVVFGQEEARLAKIARDSHKLHEAQMIYGNRAGLEAGATVAFTALGMVSVLALSAWLVANGQMPRSLYPLAVVLAGASFAPVLGLVDTARSFGQVRAAASRVFGLFDEPAPVADRVTKAPLEPVEPRVKFDKVTFRYDSSLPDALSAVSFEVQPGETVALVGHSGAGKSTCTNLLLRFWDVTGGSISLGGYDLRDWPQNALREKMALVPQDIYLFNMSIRENIRLGQPLASDAQIETATRIAQIDEFIRSLPEGYATICGERGVQLSGGQRQRIAVARALLKDTPVLVMDEAVSNLDSESEKALQAAIKELVKGRTTLVIAHRLSTIRTADRIVVLDGGRVAETGTHEELVAKDGIYSQLIAVQRDGLLVE
jgi:thiol reductant ABC exporter CydC subunit